MSRWKVWKHDCIKHGEGDGVPCRPRCDDPWQADDPAAVMGNTFATWAEALAWSDKWARRRA